MKKQSLQYPLWHPFRWIGIDKKAGSTRLIQIDKKTIAPGSVARDTSMSPFGAISDAFTAEFGTITPLVPVEAIDVVFALSVCSPLISQTIWDNITLSNSGHSIVLDGASDAVIDNAAIELSDLSARMDSGGIESWLNTAFYQLSVGGALSHEYVINDAMDGVDTSKFVDLKSIKFAPSGVNDGRYTPFQRQGGQVVLLPSTYHYKAILKWQNSPYGLPPMFAAIEPAMVQREVMGSIRGIAKKFGMLGLFTILLDMPTQDGDESDEKYEAKLKTYLTDAMASLQDTYSDGMLVGFKGQHEFKHDSVTGDARGMAEILNEVSKEAHRGANTDPALHGGDASRTETQIRQIYEKEVRQLGNQQRLVASSLTWGYNLQLLLAGYPTGLTAAFEFDKIDTLDEARDVEIQQSKRDLANDLYEDGLISQEDRAQRLGIDTPDLPGPRVSDDGMGGFERQSRRFTFQNGKYKFNRPRILLGKKNWNASGFEYESLWPNYDLDDGHSEHCGCGCSNHSELSLGKMEKTLESYTRKINQLTVRNGDRTMGIIRDYLRDGARKTDPDIFANQLFNVLANDFSARMSAKDIQKEINTFSEELYREALLGQGFKDTMGGIDLDDFEPLFNAKTDTTTLKFLQDTDLFYMGKYIKRGDTADRVKNRLINEYIGAGKDFSDKKFVQGVADALKIEYFQSERIIRTTANMSRNFASIRIMEQSQVIHSFEVAGPIDNRKCDWCLSMVGRTFRVAKGIMRMRSVIENGPEGVPTSAPILVGAISPEDLGNLTDAEVQAAGFDTPPYHPNCRDRIIAVT